MMIKPNGSISPKITKITGITNQMVIHAPDIKYGMQKLIEFIGDATLVAHNAKFDIPWLLSACHTHNITHKITETICTLEWARSLKEGSCSLGALTKKYKIGHNNAHRALADAAVTKTLFFIYLEKEKTPPIKDINSYKFSLKTPEEKSLKTIPA